MPHYVSGTFVSPTTSKEGQGNAGQDDRALIRACLRGRKEAFGELMRRYQDQLYNVVFRMLDNAEDANDVVQDSFLNAYQSLRKFQGDAKFSTWLYRIAVNSAITHRRKQKQPRSLLDANGRLEATDRSEEGQPGKVMERNERERIVHDALSRVSPEFRIVLILKELDGQKYEEIAEVLQVPIGTVRSRLHRARMELREILRNTDDSQFKKVSP